jgi:hypothetical protein
MTVHPSATSKIASDHQPPETHGPHVFRRPRIPNPLLGLRRILPDRKCGPDSRDFLAKVTSLFAPDASCRRGSPSLQRIDGADAWLFPAHFEGEPGKLPV